MGKQEWPSYEEAEVYFRKCKKHMSQGTLVKLSTACSRKSKLCGVRSKGKSAGTGRVQGCSSTVVEIGPARDLERLGVETLHVLYSPSALCTFKRHAPWDATTLQRVFTQTLASLCKLTSPGFICLQQVPPQFWTKASRKWAEILEIWSD